MGSNNKCYLVGEACELAQPDRTDVVVTAPGGHHIGLFELRSEKNRD